MDWKKLCDQDGNIYYMNEATGEASWTPPEGFVDKFGRDWIEVQNETGAVYYYNVATGESTWTPPVNPDLQQQQEKPAEPAKAEIKEEPAKIEEQPTKQEDSGIPEWVEVYDPATKAYYYFNNKTLQSSWEKPVGYEAPKEKADFSKVRALMAPELKAALMLQCAFRAKQARKDVRIQRGNKNAVSSGVSEWQEIMDPGSGLPYYFKQSTGECQWDKPADFGLPVEQAAKVEEPEKKGNEEKSEEGNEEEKSEEAKKKDNEEEKSEETKKKGNEEEKSEEAVLTEIPNPTPAAEEMQSKVEVVEEEKEAEEFNKAAEVVEDVCEDLEDDLHKEELPEWVEIFDPSSKKYYFYNNKTQECRWDEPEGYKKVDMSCMKLLVAPEVKAAMLLQNAFRAKQARKDVRKQRAEKTGKTSDSVWQEVMDPASGSPYYYNSETQEVTWDKPRELMTDTEKEAADKPQPKWCSAIDDSSGMPYYYNSETGEVTWDKPSDYDGEDGNNNLGGIDEARAEKLKRKMKLALQGKLKKLTPEMAERMRKAREEQEKAKKSGQRRWCEVYDEASDAFYYYDVDNFETTWEKPADFVMDASNELLQAALTLQGMFRTRQAKKKVRLMRAREFTKDMDKNESPAWVEVKDKDSSLTYYYHLITEALAWEKPDEDAERRKIEEAWCSAQDPETGQTYYFNSITNEVTWDKPTGNSSVGSGMDGMDEARAAELKKKMQLALEGKLKKLTPEMAERMRKAREEQEKAKKLGQRRWCEVYDEATDAFYYYDVDNFETTWEKPDDFVMEASNELLEAALRLQGMFRTRQAKKKVRLMRALELTKGTSQTDPPLWVEIKDKDTGCPYYFNKITQEITWIKPNELVVEEEKTVVEAETTIDSMVPEEHKAELAANREQYSHLSEKRAERAKERDRLKKSAEMNEQLRLHNINKSTEERRKMIKQMQSKKQKEKDQLKQKRISQKGAAIQEAMAKAKQEAEDRKRAKEEKLKHTLEQKERLRLQKLEEKRRKQELEKHLLQEYLGQYLEARTKRDAWEEENRRQVLELLESAKHMRYQVSRVGSNSRPESYADLWEAVKFFESDVLELKRLLPTGTMIASLRNDMGRTLLHEAAWSGAFHTMKALIDIAKAQNDGDASYYVQVVDSPCKMTTPLHEIARAGWGRDYVDLLIGEGARLDAKDHGGDIPLHCAARHGHIASSVALVRADPSLETLTIRNYKLRTPIDLAKCDTNALALRKANSCESFSYSGSFEQLKRLFTEYEEKVIEKFGVSYWEAGNRHHPTKRGGKSKKNGFGNTESTMPSFIDFSKYQTKSFIPAAKRNIMMVREVATKKPKKNNQTKPELTIAASSGIEENSSHSLAVSSSSSTTPKKKSTKTLTPSMGSKKLVATPKGATMRSIKSPKSSSKMKKKRKNNMK